MKIDNVLSTRQFDVRDILGKLFASATLLERQSAKRQLPQPLEGKILMTLFYEPSTRTRASFEAAILKLGGKVISSESAGMFSSAAKGESLADTVRVLSNYVDGLVIRHNKEGEIAAAAQYSSVPIINAGDGPGEHPTQALLDLYTIRREKCCPDGHHYTLVGDLKYGRTVHSLVHLLPLFKPAGISLVAPAPLRLPADLRDGLTRKGIDVYEEEALEAVLKRTDVMYMTRIQTERIQSEEERKVIEATKGNFCLTRAFVSQMKEDAIIMHPLPRLEEIPPEIDGDRRARYFEQTRHGLYLRMALLKAIYANKP